jgi:hypothetical protein
MVLLCAMVTLFIRNTFVCKCAGMLYDKTTLEFQVSNDRSASNTIVNLHMATLFVDFCTDASMTGMGFNATYNITQKIEKIKSEKSVDYKKQNKKKQNKKKTSLTQF